MVASGLNSRASASKDVGLKYSLCVPFIPGMAEDIPTIEIKSCNFFLSLHGLKFAISFMRLVVIKTMQWKIL